MLIIADNITTRNPDVDRMFQKLKATAWAEQQSPFQHLKRLVERCVANGAGVLEINIQQHHDQPEVMAAAVTAIQQITDHQLCLSTNHAATLEAGLKACQRFPLVNYVSLDEIRLKQMLPLAAKYGAEVVLLASDPTAPTDAREMLTKAAVLLGAANEVGIPNDRIFLDPGLVHITHDVGQRHLMEVREFLGVLPETFEPPVRSTCWLGNISTGAPNQLRPVVETTVLAILATVGLSSVFTNVLHPENARMLRLLKILNNECVYSDADIELRLT